MKPKRYPYSGNKKQPHEEIAELKKQIAVNKSRINHLERAIGIEYEKNLKQVTYWQRNDSHRVSRKDWDQL